MFNHAQKLFDEMPQLKCERTVKSFNALLSACANNKKPDRVTQIFRELPNKLLIKPDVVSYNTVIKAFCEARSFDSALEMIDEMEKNGLKPDVVTFNTLFSPFYQNGRSSDAEKVWELMVDNKVVPNVRSYNAKLRALVADNRISEAVNVFEEMKSRRIEPDIFSFNALIKGFCDGGNMEEAKKWHKEIRNIGCKQDTATLTMLCCFACHSGDFEYAFELCKEAISLHVFVPRRTMQWVVDGLVNESKMEETMELVRLGKSNDYIKYKLKIPSNE